MVQIAGDFWIGGVHGGFPGYVLFGVGAFGRLGFLVAVGPFDFNPTFRTGWYRTPGWVGFCVKMWPWGGGILLRLSGWRPCLEWLFLFGTTGFAVWSVHCGVFLFHKPVVFGVWENVSRLCFYTGLGGCVCVVLEAAHPMAIGGVFHVGGSLG